MSRIYVSSTFGCHREGYLQGDAEEVAREILAEGGQVTIQGPGRGDDSPNVTLLYREADDIKRHTGWYVWGKTSLADLQDGCGPGQVTCPTCGEHYPTPSAGVADGAIMECRECGRAPDEPYDWDDDSD